MRTVHWSGRLTNSILLESGDRSRNEEAMYGFGTTLTLLRSASSGSILMALILTSHLSPGMGGSAYWMKELSPSNSPHAVTIFMVAPLAGMAETLVKSQKMPLSQMPKSSVLSAGMVWVILLVRSALG